MLSHDEMISAKVALLERLVKDILIANFIAMPNSTAESEAYAERRKKLPIGFKPVADLELARQEIWAQFLDDVVAGVRKEHKSQS